MRKTGFTLAEVLIALALLGIVAAFTIPKVLQSTGDREKISKLKEVVGMLTDVTYAADLNNDLDPLLDPYKTEAPSPNPTQYQRNLVDYFASRLNSLKKCYNAQAEGCWTGSTDTTTLTVLTPTGGGLVLPNGVYIMDLEDNTQAEYGDAVYVDYNGLTQPNALGEDIMGIRLQWGAEGNVRAGTAACLTNANPTVQTALTRICNQVLR